MHDRKKPFISCCSDGCRALTEIQHDVKEAREAIEEVVDDDQNLAAVCLSEQQQGSPQLSGGPLTMQQHSPIAAGQHTPTMRLAAALLSSYERQVQSIEGSLRVRNNIGPF